MKNSLDHIREAILQKAKQEQLPGPTVDAFLRAVTKVAEGASGLIGESAIEPVVGLPQTEHLAVSDDRAGDLVKRLAVIKLNGGLGTGMGLAGPKSLLKVKGDQCFLDFIAQQILQFRSDFGGKLPAFYLMNSFSTQADTLSFLDKYPGIADEDGRLDFLQSKVPKLLADTLEPAASAEDPTVSWCPPGHGDIYPSLISSGLLESLLSRGVKYLFVSNSDNLGATVDCAILSHFADSGAGFMMEVARRTEADSKGGHLARRLSDGRLILRESAQCPDDETEQFRDVNRYTYFNTNNLWIQIERLQEELDRRDGVLELPIIKNRKTLDPRDASSPKVLQLESAMGAAIECFEQSTAVEVPRSRFSPVKTTADLLSLWSDAYVKTADHRLVLDERRGGKPPTVSLDSKHYKLMNDFEQRFAAGVPSMIDCERLEVIGDVVFEAGVVLQGAVQISNLTGEQKTLGAGIYESANITF